MYNIRAILLGAFGIGALIYFFLVSSPNAFALIILDEVMSKDTEKRTGVNKFNHNQRMALEAWLNQNFVLKTEAERQSANAPEVYLTENMDGGRKIKLSDGSTYLISPDDVARASLWITPFSIKITPSNDPNYPSLLTDTASGSSLKGKQIQAPTSPPSQ